jgi:2-methylcitrate dehydratase
MPTMTQKMAAFSRQLRYEDIDSQTIANVKRFLFDSIGVAYGGANTEDVGIMLHYYNDIGGKAEASVLNSPLKLPMVHAALLNSLMIRALDFNDIYWEQDPSHPSDIIPAALSPAEVLHRDTREAIVAIVLAYEWEQRLCEFAIPGIRERKWHHASLTQLAAPFVAGRVLGLSEAEMVNAAGISASSHMTLGAVTAGKLTMMKNTVDPMATAAGVEAAILAQLGYEGPEHVLDGKEGLIDTLGERFDLDVLTDGLGESFRINRCSMKAFPTEALTHTPISAVIKIMRDHKLQPDAVEKVTISTVARAADILADPSKYDPQTRETADHSLPYCIAAAIVDGKLTPQSFSRERIADPYLRSFLPRVEVIAEPDFEKTFPALKQAGCKLQTRTGETYSITLDYPLGDYREAMDEKQLTDKFDALVLPVIGREKRDRLVDAIWGFEKIGDVADFMQLLRQDEA